jgi:pimeloyl-ACP methyl ester carboxylesterase
MKPALTNARGLRLAYTLSHPPAATSVVVLVHGFGDDKRSKGRFPRLAEALARHDIAALAFDCAGCGESDDAVLDWDDLAGDVRTALTFARARFSRVALLGHSAGSRLCLMACDAAVTTLVLTGAALDGIDYDWRRVFSPAQLDELARTQRVTIARGDELRQRVVVSQAMLDGFAGMTRAQLLARARCPILIVNGDGDDEERLLTATVGRARAHLPPGSRIDIIAGAPHGFGPHYQEVIDRVVPWLTEKLQA